MDFKAAQEYRAEVLAEAATLRRQGHSKVRVRADQVVKLIDFYIDLLDNNIKLAKQIADIETECTLSRLPPVDGFDRGAMAARKSILQIVRLTPPQPNRE